MSIDSVNSAANSVPIVKPAKLPPSGGKEPAPASISVGTPKNATPPGGVSNETADAVRVYGNAQITKTAGQGKKLTDLPDSTPPAAKLPAPSDNTRPFVKNGPIPPVSEGLPEEKSGTTIPDSKGRKLIKGPDFTKPVTVAVIDDSTKPFDLDYDRKPDTGELRLIAAGQPVDVGAAGGHLAQVSTHLQSRFNGQVGLRVSDINGDFNKIPDKFKEVAQAIDAGENIAAVNLSLGMRFTRKAMYNLFGETGREAYDVTMENVHTKGEAWLATVNDKLHDRDNFPEGEKGDKMVQQYRKLINTVNAIEQVTERGTKVFIAGGNNIYNKGDQEIPENELINGFLFAKGTTGVAATGKDGRLLPGQPSNSLISEYGLGTYEVYPVFNRDSKVIGLNITSNPSKVDIPANLLTNGGVFNYNAAKPRTYSGSSFAAPAVLAQYVLQEMEKARNAQ